MNNTVVIITMLIVLVMAIGLPIVYSKFGYNYESVMKVLQNVLNILSNLNKNMDYEHKDIMQLIIDYCRLAVEYAEQLYIKGDIDIDDRKNKAVEYVEKSLALQNIEITEQIKNIIDATIEASVFILPSTHSETENSTVEDLR